jgi:hypothetical protein
MKFSRLLIFLLPLFLTACGLSEQQKADYAAVQRSGVNSATYDKMVHGDDLSLYDVEALARARVNDGVIIRYMRNQATVYVLNAGDVQGLLHAGVSQSVVDYMMSTPRLYQPAVYPAVYVGVGYGPYWGGPYPYPYPGPYGYPYRRGCWR